jgi:hypothetical protein
MNEAEAELTMKWKPATIEAVRNIVRAELVNCDDKQVAAFEKYRVDPYSAPLVRYGKVETVVVVARSGAEVIYWEDIEEGFNISPVAFDRRILEHWCNQDHLGLALDAWIDGRARPRGVDPAVAPE